MTSEKPPDNMGGSSDHDIKNNTNLDSVTQCMVNQPGWSVEFLNFESSCD